jgi:small subunit ribosomal protein S8e
MGISRDSRHKRRATGGKKANLKKKRLYESGRPPAMTKIGATRVHTVRVRGGNEKFRALRLDTGNFSWGSEGEFVDDTGRRVAWLGGMSLSF